MPCTADASLILLTRRIRMRHGTAVLLAAALLCGECAALVVAPAGARRAAPVRMMAQQVDGVRVGPPPDLPSLLLHNRIIYLGMPLVPSVTELIVAQLLYLNYENPSKGVYMYINSPGSGGGAFETEAFAITDTMNYVAPEIETICLGTAFGTSAMLLANGAKGKRASLPNSSIMLAQPRSQARGQASDIAIRAREVLAARQTINTILSEKTGQPLEKILSDSSRTKYLNAEQALACTPPPPELPLWSGRRAQRAVRRRVAGSAQCPSVPARSAQRAAGSARAEPSRGWKRWLGPPTCAALSRDRQAPLLRARERAPQPNLFCTPPTRLSRPARPTHASRGTADGLIDKILTSEQDLPCAQATPFAPRSLYPRAYPGLPTPAMQGTSSHTRRVHSLPARPKSCAAKSRPSCRRSERGQALHKAGRTALGPVGLVALWRAALQGCCTIIVWGGALRHLSGARAMVHYAATWAGGEPGGALLATRTRV